MDNDSSITVSDLDFSLTPTFSPNFIIHDGILQQVALDSRGEFSEVVYTQNVD